MKYSCSQNLLHLLLDALVLGDAPMGDQIRNEVRGVTIFRFAFPGLLGVLLFLIALVRMAFYFSRQQPVERDPMYFWRQISPST